MSQFDSLLDFGDSTPAETNGTTQDSQAVDDFDPFGPSPTIEAKGNVDGNLLVDFTADTEISNGTKENGTSEPFELSFEVSTSNDDAAETSTDVADNTNMSSSNPLYDLTAEQPASNPLYEFETHTTETTVMKSSSSQEFDNADGDAASSNPLYDLSNNGDMHVETTVTSTSSNPLYDLMSNGNSGFGDQETTQTVTTQKIGDDDFLIQTVTTTEHHYEDTDDVNVNTSAGQEELIQVETPRDLMDDFESREIIQDDVSQEEQAYVEMSRQDDQVDNLLGDYENTQIVSDVIIPQETVPEQAPREPSPEPAREPTPEPVWEPTPEAVREPTPEPVREPTPEPVREPTPEPVQEPTPEPVREPTPEPIREPTPEPVREPSPEPREEEDETIKDGQVVSRGKEEKRYSDSFGDGDARVVREVTVQSMGGGSAQQNGYGSNVAQDEVHFTEMSSVRNAFESGGHQQTTANSQQVQDITWEDQEEGVYENEPAKRTDVARESDRDIGAGLPEVGMAKNLLNRFTQIGSETKSYKREVTPPRQVAGGKVEFESEPAAHIQVFEGKAEAGIFESQPQVNPDVVRSGEATTEPLPERGTAKNLASKFKQLESGGGSYAPSPVKREITPDRSAGKVEFVSEPKTTIEHYEGKAEAGIFENQPQNYEGVVRSEEQVEDILPERGSAKNIAQRFKQMESHTSSTPRGKREITPDRNTQGEYVSEPRAHIDIYEGKAEAGVFENRPEDRSDVVKSDELINDAIPERGFARNVAAKFKELESSAKSPPPTPGRVKEFTPPRDTGNSGVYESHPQSSPDVVSENQPVEEIIPEKGYAKNLVSRFKQIEQENTKVAVSNRKNKEMTPPPGEAGVFENQPKQFIPEYNQKTDSGISENNPEVRSDVFKETDPAKYEEELPERGTAKNLVSRWKQMETQSGSGSPHSQGRTKEFTPPREEERVQVHRSPMMSPGAGQFESVQPGDLPGQYHQQSSPTVFESEPEHRSDVIREADTDWTEGMPRENAAKKMVAKFKHIQAEANKETPKPVSRKEDGDRQSPESEVTQVCESSPSDHNSLTYDNGVPDDLRENQEAATPKKKGGFFIPTTTADKCGACQKTVYAMEKFEMNKVIYHKNCFRCSHCKSKLTPKTFAVNNGVIFCTNHLMQLFKSKGNYDEGFGREQHKTKWQGEGLKNSEQDES